MDVAPAWRWCYDLVQPLLGELGEGELLGNGIRVAAAGSLDKHPIWNWLIKYTLRTAAEDGAAGTENMDWETSIEGGIGRLAFALACPGDLENRG